MPALLPEQIRILRSRGIRLFDTNLGVRLVGHREFVGGWGGMWDSHGRRQLDFLVSHGLQPSDVLLDIGCGSLRAGKYFIPYLEREHYLGFDKHRALIDAGLRKEL